MIWSKTEAGRREIQSRALVSSRPQRNLLLLIDGLKSETVLVSQVAGASPVDFQALQSLGLIEPLVRDMPELTGPNRSAWERFAARLIQFIASELGPQGKPLFEAASQADSPARLQSVAQALLHRVQEQQGPSAAEDLRRRLLG